MTQNQIIERIKALAKEMQTVGAAMDYFGGFDIEMVEVGSELFQNGLNLQAWIKARSE